MCGRVRLDNDYSEIKIRLKFAPDAPAPNYAVDYNNQRLPKMMKWGLIPQARAQSSHTT